MGVLRSLGGVGVRGIVTAVGSGNATITATYAGRTAEAPTSVRISTRSKGTVGVIYAAPSDREFRSDASEAITHAIVDLQSWYRQQLGGLTFSLYKTTLEECQVSQPSDFYGRYSWDKVVAGVQHCAPVEEESLDFRWVVHADVVPKCGSDDMGFETLGRGWEGLTILPRSDLDGVVGRPGTMTTYCDGRPVYEPLGRWIGGPKRTVLRTRTKGRNGLCQKPCAALLGQLLYLNMRQPVTPITMGMRVSMTAQNCPSAWLLGDRELNQFQKNRMNTATAP